MRQAIVLVLLLISLVNVSFGVRCLLYMERCVTHCPRNMHPYHTRCDMDTDSQRTCTYPEVYTLGYTCGWSRCDCNGELVMDDDGVCIDYKYCTGMGMKRKKYDVPGGKKRRRSQKIKIREQDEIDVG